MESLETLLATASSRGASDLLVMVGDSPAMRVAGQWIRFDLPRCNDEAVQGMVRKLLQDDVYEELKRKREADFSYSFPKIGRVRCNVHYQRDHLAFVLRLLWPELPDARKLGIPAHVVNMGDTPHGLILVSGPTGSGKSTTLAAIVEYINTHRPAHIITIEDPIEFIYNNKRSIIEQREIGSDTSTWKSGLRNVLRQAPDVIVLGELRDLDSISIALTAAETGHLVLASLHSSTAASAVSRIIDAFPSEQQSQARLQLAQSLRMVFAQRLVPGIEPETRVLTYETMMGTPAICNMIRANEIEQIPNAINSGRDSGMNSFQQSQRELMSRKLIPDRAMC